MGRKVVVAVLLFVAMGACGPPQLAELESSEFAGITEFDTNCGWDGSVTSFLHLADYFDSEARVLETVQPNT